MTSPAAITARPPEPQRTPIGVRQAPGATAPTGGVDTPAAAEGRWRAAIAVQPLETPQPLTGRWAALAVALTGRAHTRVTTGARTRHALAAAGALGATTGSTVHLAGLPGRDAAPGSAPVRVLAHELAHSRTPVARPRFLLAGLIGHDEEERAARVGEGAAAMLGGAASRAGAGLGSASALAGSQGDQLRSRAGDFIQSGRQEVAAGLASARSVADLPVSGLAGLREAVGGLIPGAAGLPGAGLGEAVSGVADAVPAQLGDLAGAAQSSLGGLAGSARSAVEGAAGQVGGVMDAVGSSAGAALGAAGKAASALGSAVSPSELDRLFDAMEDRLLRELERRGGRYEGMF